MDARYGRASQLAELVLSLVEELKQASQDYESVHPEGRAAGVGSRETNISGIQMKKQGIIYSV
jgi:hypothetical protein